MTSLFDHADLAAAKQLIATAPEWTPRGFAEKSLPLLMRAVDHIEALEAALRLMIQYGVDEDDQVWIAPNPAGVGRAATVLGIDARFVRESQRA